jgi:hypothetical protein
MNRNHFIETLTGSGGFVAAKVPAGSKMFAHTVLFRSNAAEGIGAVSYQNSARDQTPSQLFIEVLLGDETFIKTVDVDDEKMLEDYFFRWAQERDGVNSPEQIAANMKAFEDFSEAMNLSPLIEKPGSQSKKS